MSGELLSVEHVSVAYAGGPPVLGDVSLTVGRGETVGLVGESGSGKTTLGRAVLGLLTVTSGRIVFDGTDVGHLHATRRGATVHRIQTVFQDPNGSLNPARKVGDSVAESLAAGDGLTRAERRRRAGELLDRVGLPVSAVDRYPFEFSGGQRQRIAIARALAAEPELIVCDEPTSALDLSTQAQMLNLLTDLQAERGLAYLFISHDLAVVRHVADRVVVLYQGRAMESGPAHQVSAQPLHPYTRALHSAAPVADAVAQRARRSARIQAAAESRGRVRIGGSDACPFAVRCPQAHEVCATRRPREAEHGEARLACHLYDPDSGHPDALERPKPPGSPSTVDATT
ncbi:ABC transporter ATP-binding protein [Streptomyces coelicoflavus]|uniref:ABC transporter ATP-binding protein n=1 Tax=Streptomyces coelicoflavus TaxID=285562 RepID=UPI003326E8CB